MKTYTPSNPITTKLSILLIGPPGARKTTLALTFPSLYVIDCDENLKGPAGHLSKSNPTFSFAYECASFDAQGKPLATADRFDRILDLMKEAAASDREWVLLDGLSTINDIIIDKIMKQQNIPYMEARNWSTFKSDAVKILFTKARQLNKNFIITAHEEEMVRQGATVMAAPITIGYEPYLQGSTRERLGGFFTDVWRLETNLGPADKIETTLTTDKVGLMKQLKNSVGLPHTVKNPTYELLHKLSAGVL